MSTTFSYQGSSETWDVGNYRTITVQLYGAGGEDGVAGDYSAGSGGNGGYVEGELDVEDFDQLTIYVGGGNGNTWGYHNGGSGGSGYRNGKPGGNGGGSTQIIADGTSLIAADAGGGGGGGTDSQSPPYNAYGGDGGGGARGGISGDRGQDAEGSGNGGDGGDGGYYTNVDGEHNASTGGDNGQNGGAGVNSTYVSNYTTSTGGGNSGNGEIVLTTPDTHSPPANATSEYGHLNVNLNWDSVSAANEYWVYRNTSSPVEAISENYVGSTTSTSYTDETVSDATQYYYVVTAVNDYYESDPSSEVAEYSPGTVQLGDGTQAPVYYHDGTQWQKSQDVR